MFAARNKRFAGVFIHKYAGNGITLSYYQILVGYVVDNRCLSDGSDTIVRLFIDCVRTDLWEVNALLIIVDICVCGNGDSVMEQLFKDNNCAVFQIT